MAEIPFGGSYAAPNEQAHAYDQGGSQPRGEAEPQAATGGTLQAIGTLTNWAGAAISLSLIVGIGIWGYKTISRDVSGVPVVRAASGKPMRVAPADPGGAPALHQGLAVNEVAADGAAAKPADRLVLAPPPVALEEEDMPGEAAPALAAAQGGEADGPVAGGEAPQMASIRALAEKLATGTDPLGEAVTAEPETLQQAAVVLPAAEPEAVPEAMKKEIEGGIKASLRPRLRPGKLAAAAVATPVAAAVTQELEVTDIPAGTRLAQLGAFDSPEVARKEWDRLSARFGDYMDGKQRVIQKAQSGGRTFYRLRAIGFADLNDARRFCSALVAERADCIPVTSK